MKNNTLLFLIILLCLAAQAWAADCTPQTAVGEDCSVLIAELHPTQFTLGMEEVAEKTAKLRKMSAAAREGYADEHAAPIVIGPGGLFYMVDHHTTARVLQNVGETRMSAKVLARLDDSDAASFWRTMQEKGWVFLYKDACAAAPSDPADLPATVDQMKDEPYRTLAKAVRKAGGYEDIEVFFEGDMWARQFCLQGLSADAVDAAVALAHAPVSRSLPGYKAQ